MAGNYDQLLKQIKAAQSIYDRAAGAAEQDINTLRATYNVTSPAEAESLLQRLDHEATAAEQQAATALQHFSEQWDGFLAELENQNRSTT